MVKKANSRLWFLRRIKNLGASVKTLLDLYKLFVRSAVEEALQLWTGSITKTEKDSIEKVQITSVKLILGSSYTNYIKSLEKLKLETLSIRREKLCLKFAKKCTNGTKTDKFKHWFPKKTSLNTRTKGKYLLPIGKSQSYLRSSIPYLTDILNKNCK